MQCLPCAVLVRAQCALAWWRVMGARGHLWLPSAVCLSLVMRLSCDAPYLPAARQAWLLTVRSLCLV